MDALRANARVIGIIVAVLVIGGWLILTAANAGGPSSPLGPSFQIAPPDESGPPRLDRVTPEASEAPVQRWASSPMPPPGRESLMLPTQGPVIVPSASAVVMGTEITIRGQDFASQSEVSISLERAGTNGALIAEELLVNRDGTFAVPFAPGAELSPGDYTIVARSGGKEARAHLKLVGSKPVALVDPSAAKPGQELEFAGGGFAPGEEVGVYLDTLASAPFVTVQADDHGNVASEFLVPMAAEGEHRLVLMGASSRVLALAQFTVIGFYPWVDLSSYASRPEITIDFMGHSFAPGEEVWVYVDQLGGNPLGRARTDDEGEFELMGAFFVPPSLRGDHKFLFVGSASQKTVEATFTALPYTPSLELDPYAGKAGSKLSLAGEGFASGENLRAYWGAPEDGVLLSESKASPDGSFTGWGALTVPYDADSMKGGANITVVGEVSQAQASAWFTLVPLTPAAELSKYVGPAGETLQFSGNGFAPTERVVITLADRPDVLAVAQTNEEGSFENAGSFTVPQDQTEVIEFVFTGMLSNAEARTHYRIGVPEGNGAPPTPDVQ